MSNETTAQSQSLIECLNQELTGQKSMYVLYLDDEPDLLEPFSDLVQKLGLKPLVAGSQVEALAHLKSHRSDLALIVSDFKMPNGDGFAFRAEVKGRAPEIPFAILSAYVDTAMALRGLELKICAFLSKPLSEALFFETIQKEALPRIRSIKEDRELLAGFISETEGLIGESENLLLAIEEDPSSAESLNRFFGIIHTIKGASSFFEPKHLHRLAHRYEDLLKKLQRGDLKFSEAVSAVLFQGIDRIKELFGEFVTGTFAERDLELLLKEVDEPQPTHEAVSSDSSLPSPVDSAQAASPTAAATATPANTRSREDVKVSVALLNEFMQLSGEITVVRNMLNKCVRSIERSYSGDRDVAMLADLLEELHKINSGVQNKISEVRKVPVKGLIKALPRAVRDLSKTLNKQIELEINGDDLRVDTSVAEVVSNCLLHIVKNSIDHGLEKTEIRQKLGKPVVGHIKIDFSVKDDNVLIEVCDDGAGINCEAIRSKLRKNGHHTEAEIIAMPDPELYQMIFASGFSTAEKVTDISGRGVGMSMVKDSVTAMGGEIQIESVSGQGAKFRLVLPIPKSVLIASCLSVRANHVQVCLLQDDIERVLQYDSVKAQSEIQKVGGGEVVVFGDELIPLASLFDLMHGGAPVTLAARSQVERRIIVMKSNADERRMAIEVDEILDVEDTVVKSIHPALNPAGIYRGITFLDDGSLGLILSTVGILDRLKIQAKPKQKTHKASTADEHLALTGASTSTALVFELSHAGSYALPLSDIHRIEEMNSKDIRTSGGASIVPYRGGVLQLLDLDRLFDQGESTEAVFPVLVVRRNQSWIGLRVKAIRDMVEYSSIQSDCADAKVAIQGHFMTSDRPVAMLSSEQVIAQLTQGAEPLAA